MLISESIDEFKGMSIQDGVDGDYRDSSGALTLLYLRLISQKAEHCAKDFELACKAFYYHYPLDGTYRISWKIERIE